MCQAGGATGRHRDGRSSAGSRAAPAGRQPGMGTHSLLAAWGSAVAPESLQELSLGSLLQHQ